MSALPEDFQNNQRLTSSFLNVMDSAVNSVTATVPVVEANVSAMNVSLTTTQVSTNTNQQDILAASAALAAQTTLLNNMQATAVSLDNRITVLENATPPPPTPGKPTGLTTGTITQTTIVLDWMAPSGTAPTSYQTRRATPPGSGNWINGPLVSAPTVTTTFTGLTQATAYDLSVIPANAAGPGVVSDTITASTLPTLTPSPAWTEMPPATSIVMNDSGVVTVSGGVIFLNGSPMGDTGNVILVLKSDTGRIYQENSDPNWWYWDPTQTDPWVFTSDPRPSLPSSGAPAIATAVGYNQLTFGPNPRTGWFVANGTAVDQPDGAVRLISGDGNNSGYVTALLTGGYMGYTGTTFGGGAYFRFTAKWSGPGLGVDGSPALFMLDMEGQTGFNLTSVPIQYPGRPNGSNLWFGPDVMSDQGNDAPDYGSTLWLFSTEFLEVQAALQRKTFPGGFTDRTSYHTFGLLWVPATPTARGYMAYCYDDVEYQRVTWDYRTDRSTLPMPPTVTDLGGNISLINVGSDIDWRHMYLLMGSGSATPIDVLKVEVWQAGAPPPPTGGPGTGPAFQTLTTSLDMLNGQRCSTGVTLNTPGVAAAGFYQVQIKPYEVNGIWRATAAGNYIGPLTAAFPAQGTYLYLPDVASVFSATGCPAVNPTTNPISGVRPHVRWWTAGAITSPIRWGLYFEPGMTTDGHGDLYAVIVDFNRARGDTFHTSGVSGDLVKGLGVIRNTSWGSIWDLTGVPTGVPGYGLGWVAFNGYNMTMDQIIADW